MVADEFATHRVVGWGLRRLGVRFVSRSERAQGVESAGELEAAINSGESLVMFPDGSLGPRSSLGSFHLGAFAVAANAQVPVTPISISGTRHVLTPHDRRPRAGTVSMVIHPPTHAPAQGWEGAIELRNQVRSVIEQELRGARA